MNDLSNALNNAGMSSVDLSRHLTSISIGFVQGSWDVGPQEPPVSRVFGQQEGRGIVYEGPESDTSRWEDLYEERLEITRPPRGIRSWQLSHRIVGPSFWMEPEARVTPHFIDLREEWVLGSLATDYVWEEAKQVGMAGDFLSNQNMHKYGGFHSYKLEAPQIARSMEWLAMQELSSRDAPTAIGVVAHSGTVIEHERGFRSSQAEIVALWVSHPRSHNERGILDSLKERYMVPVFPFPPIQPNGQVAPVETMIQQLKCYVFPERSSAYMRDKKP